MKFRVFFVTVFFVHSLAYATDTKTATAKSNDPSYTKDQGQKIGYSEILELVEKKHDTSDLVRLKREASVLEARSQSLWDNPMVAFGKGRLSYNGGSGITDYNELSVSQNIPLNGAKSSLKKQGQILSNIGEIEAVQTKLSMSSSALLAGARYKVAKEQFKHTDERRNFFALVSRFLKSRKFNSPKQQIEIQLIESKLEQVVLETKAVESSLDSSIEILKLYIGDFEESNIDIDFLDAEKTKVVAGKLATKDLIESKKISQKEKFFKEGELAAKRKWIPDLQVYYTQNKENYSGGNRNQVLGLGIEVPIFNRGNSKYKFVVAQRTASQIEYEISSIQSLANKKDLVKKINVGLDYITIYDQEKMNSLEKRLNKFEKDYRKGLVNASSFLELEDNIHMILNGRLENQYEILKSLLGLVEMTGDESSLRELL